MYRLDKVQAKKILTSELNYSPTDADVYLKDYPPIHDELSAAVQRWIADRAISDVKIFGVSINEVMHARGSHFLMAVRAINRLLDSDISPEQRERMIKNLRKRIPIA